MRLYMRAYSGLLLADVIPGSGQVEGTSRSRILSRCGSHRK